MKLSIIVPYRNRQEHLNNFIPFIKNYLNNIVYDINIIEQLDDKPFNRGKLLNIGFNEVKHNCDYVCFHDVDMLPENSDYSYVKNPTHLATNVEQFNYLLPYDGYFGGVVIMDKNNFIDVNGYSNEYWGWGAEDDDFRERFVTKQLKLDRKKCFYKSLYHKPNGDTNGGLESEETKNNRIRFNKLRKDPFYFLNDGLSNLNYTVIEKTTKDEVQYIKVTL